jgi:hypothetical protein
MGGVKMLSYISNLSGPAMTLKELLLALDEAESLAEAPLDAVVKFVAEKEPAKFMFTDSEGRQFAKDVKGVTGFVISWKEPIGDTFAPPGKVGEEKKWE